MRLFLDAFHRQFPAAFFALLGADTPAAVEAARQKLQTVLEVGEVVWMPAGLWA